MGPNIAYEGVSFITLRAAITATYFLYEGMPEDEWMKAQSYVVPAQHNFELPIEPEGQDTWIQYWIDEDERLTQDANVDGANGTRKVARVTLRFLGTRAEVWAKVFHHLAKRKSVSSYFSEYCNAVMFEYIGPIIPVNVDYFKAGNAAIAYDLSFSLQYMEYMEFENTPLEYISVGAGEITGRKPTEEV